MKKIISIGKASLMLISLLVVSIGATGCLDKIKEISKDVKEVADENRNTSDDSSVMNYLNSIIEATNFPNDRGNWIFSMLDNHYKYGSDKECTYGGSTSELAPMEDQSSLLGNNVSLSDKSIQDKVEPKFKDFIESYQVLVEAHNQFSDYCSRESYKDDGGVQIKILVEDVKNKLDVFQDKSTNLSKIVEEIQEGIDLGIDENTTDPQEIIVLSSDTITADAKKAYRAYNTWLKDKVDGGDPSVAEMKSAHEKLKADLNKYTKKSEALNAEEQDLVGTHFASYLDAVKKFDVEYEKFVRDAENGAITGEKLNELVESEQEYWGGKITETYNGVIDAHNLIVSVSSY